MEWYSLICNLIDGYEARPCLWNIFCDDNRDRDVTGNTTALKCNVREGSTSVSKKILGSDASTLRDFDKLSWTSMDGLIPNMIVNIVNDSWNYHRLSSTIMTVWTGLNAVRKAVTRFGFNWTACLCRARADYNLEQVVNFSCFHSFNLSAACTFFQQTAGGQMH